MLKNIFLWIIQNIFKINTETTDFELNANEQHAKKYEAIDEINFNAIFANKLANYVANDSTFLVDGNNARAELLNMTGTSMWKKIKKIVSMSLGYGGLILVPYVKGGKIYYNLVPQNRLTIDETLGDLITGATVLAEKKIIKSTFNQEKVYIRWTNYQIKNNNLTITQQYSDKEGNKIPAPDFWKDIQEVMSISNVDRVPFGYIKCPQNNRVSNDKYGVPITFGCENTIKEIKTCLKQIADEFDIKQVFVAIDKTALDKSGRLPQKHIFVPFDAGTDDFWNIFDPAFRETSYYNRLQQLFHQLEIEVGTSAGILTEIQTAEATATAIKRAMFDTFAMVDAIRTNVEDGLNDFFLACNVLANAYNLSANGNYEVKIDWDYSIRTDSQETFNQRLQGYSNDVISKAELRNWIMGNEDMEESEKKIKEIEEETQEQTLESMLGQGINIQEEINKNDEEEQKEGKEKNKDKGKDNKEEEATGT